MTLAFEVIGVVVLAAALRALLPTPSIPLTTAIAAFAIAVGGASFWLNGYSSARSLLDEHASDRQLTRGQANAAGGGIFPADEGFLAWADALLPRKARVFLECTGHCPGEWVTFRLSPRVFVSSPEQAEYALFYDIDPKSVPYTRGKPIAIFTPQDISRDVNFVAGQEAIVTLRP
jgi:hypothetical protein